MRLPKHKNVIKALILSSLFDLFKPHHYFYYFIHIGKKKGTSKERKTQQLYCSKV